MIVPTMDYVNKQEISSIVLQLIISSLGLKSTQLEELSNTSDIYKTILQNSYVVIWIG